MRTFFSFLALCAATVSVHAGQPASKGLIIPGTRIGQIEIGEDLNRVIAVLGEPKNSEGAMGRGWSSWYSKPVNGAPPDETMVYTHRDASGKHEPVEQIAVTSAFFHTEKGISASSDLAAIWREFPDLHYCCKGDGSQANVELYDATGEGIAFAIEHASQPAPGQPWGKCRAIIVHQAGLVPSFYTPRQDPEP